jgi:predicted  nucleic acid-binding Zn-ribbon protein
MTSNDLLGPLHQRRSRVNRIAEQLKALQSARQDLEFAIESYRSFVPELEMGKIERLGNTAADLSRKITDQDANRKSLENRLRETQSAKANPRLFWKLFTAEQRQLRAVADQLGREISAAMTQLTNDQKALSKARADASTARKRLSEHENFDLDKAESRRSSLELEIERINADHVVASAELARIETKIRPHTQEYDRLKSEAAALNADISAANRLDQKLDAAANGYERKLLHDECQAKFGTGKPREVIKDRTGQLRRLENNIPKLERRIRDELQKLHRSIKHLLIDGNNVCYEGQSFIGLRGISALLMSLGDRYKTTVVFDASIRAMLKTDSQGIERTLGPSVSTHVAPTKTAADEYLLKLAEKDENAFILSNDRYAEYHDYDAVKSGRLLRFLIADGKLMANDLDVTVII